MIRSSDLYQSSTRRFVERCLYIILLYSRIVHRPYKGIPSLYLPDLHFKEHIDPVD